MNSVPPPKEPITPQVLWRHKTLILIVAFVVVVGGYLRIVTEDRSYTSTTTLQVRFVGDAIEIPEGPNTRAVRLPLLEEQVKAYILQIQDPLFVDRVLRDLEKSESSGGTAVAVEEVEVEQTAMERLRNGIASAIHSVKRSVLDALDRLLLVEDTVVSDRERQVYGVLGGLLVTAGENASHLITISYRDRDPVRSARIANGIARSFIEVQKEKAEPRNVDRLRAAVGTARQAFVDTTGKKYQLLARIGSPSIDEAIRVRQERLEALKREEIALRNALALTDEGVVPSLRDLSVELRSRMNEREWIWNQSLIPLLREIEATPERAKQITRIIEMIESARATERKELIGEIRANVSTQLATVDKELQAIADDRELEDLAPKIHEATVLEAEAQANLLRAETELTEAEEFNELLANKNVSEHVKVWQAAQVPPFPDQQRRLLKFLVVLVLGVFAGCAAAVARHILFPATRPGYAASELDTYRAPVGAPIAAAAATAVPVGALDVPIVVLPDDADDDVDGDIEFDMSFGEEEDAPSRSKS